MRIGFGGVVVAAAMIAMSTGAAAVDDVVFTASGVVSGGEGEIRLLGEVTVAPELVGATCTGRAETANQDSVHPNNDMIITTGTTQAEIPDFESAPFKVTPLSGTVVLGPTVRFEVRLGPTFVSSGGVVVTLDCTPVGPPTTPAPPTTPPPDPATTPAPADHDRRVRGTHAHDRRASTDDRRCRPSPVQERYRTRGPRRRGRRSLPPPR